MLPGKVHKLALLGGQTPCLHLGITDPIEISQHRVSLKEMIESPRIDVVPDHFSSRMDEITAGRDCTIFACSK